jgi:hypothetical protein
MFFTEQLLLISEIVLRAANESLKRCYPEISQPEMLLEDLQLINIGKMGPGITFVARYRPLFLDCGEYYTVRIVLVIDHKTTKETHRLQASGSAFVHHYIKRGTEELSRPYLFEITWPPAKGGPIVVFKKGVGGLLSID